MARWMELPRLSLVVLGVAAILLAGCGGDDDDNGDNGNNGVGPNGDGQQITEANAEVVWSRVSTVIMQSMTRGPGTHNGTHSGTVTIAMSKPAQGTVSATFDGYSDDGELWLDGTVSFAPAGANYLYTMDMDISGVYHGTVEGQMTVTPTGGYSGYWNVDGTRVDF